MTKPLINCEETICAISSAAGAAARAIVRISGDEAMKIGDQIFTSALGMLVSAQGFTFVDGVISATLPAGVVELPARAYIFRAPHSYTRQDLVEFHIPGSPVAAAVILDEIISRGARQSHAGEFTARAFVLGRIDLSQAEAVADIINAEDDAHARAAMSALGGTIHTLCHSAAAELADILALIEASIDLSDQGISFDNPSAPAGQLRAIGTRLVDLISHSGDMPDSSAMPTVAIAGLPNAGKSSLMNAIVGAERSIVSGVAGTTRDVLSWRVELKDFGQVELQDLAGIDDGDCAIASAARQAAWRAVEAASAIIFVADVSSADLALAEKLLNEISRINPRSPVIVVGNKSDLVSEPAVRLENFASQSAVSKKLAASATAGDGIDSLIAELRRVLVGDCQLGGYKLGLHLRQRRCLSIAADAIDRCAELLDDAEELADVAELAAVELRQSLWQIGQVSGQVVTEDILGRIFRRFCVGK